MNLWLSPHGIWYFRKVTIMPCGRRKEIKKTLRTRDKSEAKQKVLELLACVRSGGKTRPVEPLPSSFLEQASLPASDPKVVPNPPANQVPVPSKPPRTVETPKLSWLADKYLKERGMSWAAQETRHQKHYLYTFIERAGDMPVTKYGKQDAVSFKDWLMTSGKSPTTINKYLQKLSLFFKWIANHHEGVNNVFEGLSIQRAKETKPRTAYTPEEFRQFISWAKGLKGHRKWISLLGAYTGARANEICQLYADDVQCIDGIWCLNIRSNRPDQKLKTENSARLVPIHSDVLAEGFLGFVEGRIGLRLFPELSLVMGYYSHGWGKWFNRNRPTDKDFHSLRHTVGTELKSAGVPIQYTAAILGHETGGISYDRYGGQVAINNLKMALESVLSKLNHPNR